MIRGIIFDCFGVLVGKGFGDIYAVAGGDPVKDNAFIDSMIIKANSGAISDEIFETVMADRLGLTLGTFHDIVVHEEALNKSLIAYIRTELKPHYKIGLLSNASTGIIESRIPAEDRALFDAIVVSAETAYQKPDTEIFQMTIDKLGTTFEETIFIDDLAIFTKPATKLGMHGIQYKGLDLLKTQLEPLLK
jgi:HAD superfamily hydrolase (TIGR01509 family)